MGLNCPRCYAKPISGHLPSRERHRFSRGVQAQSHQSRGNLVERPYDRRKQTHRRYRHVPALPGRFQAALDETYFAWYGPTTPGSAAYFRVTGPTIVIEYAAQGPGGGGGARAPSHIHGIYRDPTNDYAARYVRGDRER